MLDALVIHPWAYPMLEVIHLLGVSLLLGNLALLEMRVFGAGQSLAVRPLAKLSLSLALAGFALAGGSGLLMFASQAEELLTNQIFTAKMLLLVLAGCNAGWFHGRQSLDRLDTLAKLQLVVSALLWLLILGCGRWIAYV